MVGLSRNAPIAGMEEDLESHGSGYQWLLTIFYIAYVSFVVVKMFWGIIPPHIWITITVLGWAAVHGAIMAGSNGRAVSTQNF